MFSTSVTSILATLLAELPVVLALPMLPLFALCDIGVFGLPRMLVPSSLVPNNMLGYNSNRKRVKYKLKFYLLSMPPLLLSSMIDDD